ncbi:hypothetical protein GCM10022419_036080 [Nonomuraea rosea]|uniref:Pyrrolo-quinoline quinone repeat domain-containing protein n=1 Tax=Nonomuraea rosea TaxID=638574 RepID=A0ABP6WJB8_9ACTN
MTRRTALMGCAALLAAGCRAEAREAPPKRAVSAWPVGIAGLDQLPAVTPAAVYVATSSGEVYALHPRTGAARWRTRVPDEPGAAAIAWQSTPLPVGDLLVVGNGRGRPAFDSDNPSQVVALRASDGRVAWTADVDDYAHELLAADGLILCRTNSTLYAVDPASGRQRWRWPSGDLRAMSLAGRTVLVTERLPQGEQVVAVEARTGRRSWTARFPTVFVDWVYASGDLLVLAGYPVPGERAYALAVLAAGTGKKVWSRAPDQVSGFAAVSGGVLYTADRTRLRALSVAGGSEAWSLPLPEPAVNPMIAVDDDTVFCAMPVRRANGLYPLRALRKGDGRIRWTCDLRGAATVLTRVVPGIVHVQMSEGGRDSVVALDARGGEELWSARIDDAGQLIFGNGLLYVFGQHLIALDPATGTRL